MKNLPTYAPLVILGSWNRAIFNPDWVKKYLFSKDDKINIEVPINNSIASFKFNVENISVSVLDQRLLLGTDKPTVENFTRIGNIGKAIFRFLPHTPVTAFGINHAFEAHIDELKDNIFSLSDEENLKDAGYKEESIRIGRDIHLSKSCTLHFAIQRNGKDHIIFDFNYNFNLESFEYFSELFDIDDIVIKHKECVDFLKEIYGLEYEK